MIGLLNYQLDWSLDFFFLTWDKHYVTDLHPSLFSFYLVVLIFIYSLTYGSHFFKLFFF
jgi:hypothetical protein